MKILDDVRKISSLNELEEYIRKLFNNSIDDSYMPAIIDEGNYTSDEGDDFYLKLVLAHQRVSIKKPWLKENLSFGILDPGSEEVNCETIYDLFVENVITQRKVKGNNLYQINPLLVNDSVEEYEYDNNSLVNASYHDEYSSIKGIPILKTTNDIKLLVLKDVLFPYLNDTDGNYYPKYKLVAEYEYRTHTTELIDCCNGIIETGYGAHDVLVDKQGTRILGSIEIELNKKKHKKQARSIKVIDLKTGKSKPHNPKNFDDDINAGFVIFKKDILRILKDEYYFYDLMIIDKTHTENNFLIDVFSDKIVFWEGEYNRLLQDLKDIIDEYNYVPEKIENIISSAMKAWQLDSDWDYHKKLPPEQLLAWKVRHTYFNSAIEIGITFLIPESIQEFSIFIKNIEKISNVKLESFNENHNEVKDLLKIRDKLFNRNKNYYLEALFRKYCYQIYKVLSKDDE